MSALRPGSTPGRALLRGTIVVAAAFLVAWFFERNVRRWWFLNDDAFITFRYARNLVEGNGLVYNLGERVEGYTEFLFALLMAGGIALGLAPETLSNAATVSFGAAILCLVAVHGARRFGWTSPFTWVAPLLLALNRVFAAWSTSGMAIQLFALLVLVALLRLAREHEEPGLSPIGSALWLAAASLARPEGCMLAVIAGGFVVLDVLRRKRSARAALLWIVTYAAIVGVHFVWRRWYYGSWLPNTFHAKVAGFYPTQGYAYLRLFFRDFPLHWFAPLLLLLLRRPRRFEHALFGTYVAAQLVWLFSIGGDWHEFRFFCPILPLIALMFAEALARLAGVVRPAIAGKLGRRAVAAGVAAALLATTHWGSHRPDAQEIRDRVDSVDRLAGFTRHRAAEAFRMRRLIEEGKLPSDLRIATGAAGILPWYTRLHTVDVLGLNDAEIARIPVKKRGVIGHERFATAEILARRGVALFDAANSLFWRGPVEKLPRMSRNRVDRGAPLRCVRAGDRYLLFSSSLSESEFAETFGGLERVF